VNKRCEIVLVSVDRLFDDNSIELQFNLQLGSIAVYSSSLIGVVATLLSLIPLSFNQHSFHQSNFYLSNILFIIPTSILA